MMLVALPHPLAAYTDANVYVRAAEDGLFKPFEGRTAGYPLLLRTLHGVWDSAVLPIVLQHLLALATGVLAYVAARAGGVARAGATLVTACCVLTIDGLWLEHQVLTETVATFLLVAAVALIVTAPRIADRFVVGRRSAIGALLVLSVVVAIVALASPLTRPAMFPATLGVGLCVLIVPRVGLHTRFAGAAVVLVVAVGLFMAYLGAQERETGTRALIATTPASDIGAYPGIAPVAECSRFTVPPGTESLCQRSDPDDRPGSDFYYYDPRSPARELLAARPETSAAIKLWSTRAIDAHGSAFRAEKVNAFQRLFGLGGFRRPLTDQGTHIVNLDGADRVLIPSAADAIRRYYGPNSLPDEPAGAPWGVLTALQPVTRLSGPPVLLALLAALAGAVWGRGPARRLAIGVAVTAWLPALYGTYSGATFNWRYVLSLLPLIALAGVAGAAALQARRTGDGAVSGGRDARGRSAPAQADTGGW